MKNQICFLLANLVRLCENLSKQEGEYLLTDMAFFRTYCVSSMARPRICIDVELGVSGASDIENASGGAVNGRVTDTDAVSRLTQCIRAIVAPNKSVGPGFDPSTQRYSLFIRPVFLRSNAVSNESGVQATKREML